MPQLERQIPRIVTKLRDVLTGVRAVSPEERTTNYLNSLAEADRTNVVQFVGFARELRARVDAGFVIQAVGSTTRPAEEREFGPEAHDIDLRVMTVTAPESPERETAIQVIRDGIREYLQGQEIPFEESDQTTSHRMVKSQSFGNDGHTTEGMSPYIDYNNDDSSFEVTPEEGLPLHVFISGPNMYDADQHIQKEQKHNASAVVLLRT